MHAMADAGTQKDAGSVITDESAGGSDELGAFLLDESVRGIRKRARQPLKYGTTIQAVLFLGQGRSRMRPEKSPCALPGHATYSSRAGLDHCTRHGTTQLIAHKPCQRQTRIRHGPHQPVTGGGGSPDTDNAGALGIKMEGGPH